MQTDEKIYFRQSLDNVKCTSSQIANSYLAGRIDKEELFSINGEKKKFADILLQDEVVRGIIGPHRDQLFSEQNKIDNFSKRYELFKKIVLRGDDSLAPLLLELDAMKEQMSLWVKNNADLQKNNADLQKNNEDLQEHNVSLQKDNADLQGHNVSLQKDNADLQKYNISLQKDNAGLQKRNEGLVGTCENVVRSLQYFKCVLDISKRDLDSGTDSLVQNTDIFLIIKDLTDDFYKKLQDNIGTATASDVSMDKAIEDINIIDNYRKETIEEMKRRRERDNEKIKAAWEGIDNERKNLKQERIDCEEHIEKLKKMAKEEIFEKENELNMLMNEAGVFRNKIQAEASKIFLAKNVCTRWYSRPNIPSRILYRSIKECGGEVAPNSVLALFDCSSFGTGSSGVLVSTHAFYIFNAIREKNNINSGLIKKYKKYGYCCDDVIMTERRAAKLRVFGLTTGCLLLIVGIVTAALVNYYWFFYVILGTLVFVLSFCLPSSRFMVKYNNNIVAAFPRRNAEGVEQFCKGINQLCKSCEVSKERIEQFENVAISI